MRNRAIATSLAISAGLAFNAAPAHGIEGGLKAGSPEGGISMPSQEAPGPGGVTPKHPIRHSHLAPAVRHAKEQMGGIGPQAA